MRAKLSASARCRLIRQCKNTIDRLTAYLSKCKIEEVKEIQRQLFAEKEALRQLSTNERRQQ